MKVWILEDTINEQIVGVYDSEELCKEEYNKLTSGIGIAYRYVYQYDEYTVWTREDLRRKLEDAASSSSKRKDTPGGVGKLSSSADPARRLYGFPTCSES